MNHFHRNFVREVTVGIICACVCALPALTAENHAPGEPDSTAADPDSVPRVVGGGSTVGGAQNTPVIPYALPEVSEGSATQPGVTPWGAPDLSGIYTHEARTFQDPFPSTGVTPGRTVEPMALTLRPEMVTDRLGSRGDYHTPLLRPWAAELIKRLGNAENANQPYFERCLQGDGLLIQWSLGNRGLEIVQTPERIYLFFGQDASRVIHLDTEHPTEAQKRLRATPPLPYLLPEDLCCSDSDLFRCPDLKWAFLKG